MHWCRWTSPARVTCEKVYGYPYEVRNGKVQIRFNDIYAKDEKAILIKLTAAPSVNEQLTFNCRLQYIDAENLKDMNLQQSVMMKPTNDAAVVKEGEDKLVQEMIALFESTEEFDKMMADVDAGNCKMARQDGQQFHSGN